MSRTSTAASRLAWSSISPTSSAWRPRRSDRRPAPARARCWRRIAPAPPPAAPVRRPVRPARLGARSAARARRAFGSCQRRSRSASHRSRRSMSAAALEVAVRGRLSRSPSRSSAGERRSAGSCSARSLGLRQQRRRRRRGPRSSSRRACAAAASASAHGRVRAAPPRPARRCSCSRRAPPGGPTGRGVGEAPDEADPDPDRDRGDEDERRSHATNAHISPVMAVSLHPWRWRVVPAQRAVSRGVARPTPRAGGYGPPPVR